MPFLNSTEQEESHRAHLATIKTSAYNNTHCWWQAVWNRASADLAVYANSVNQKMFQMCQVVQKSPSVPRQNNCCVPQEQGFEMRRSNIPRMACHSHPLLAAEDHCFSKGHHLPAWRAAKARVAGSHSKHKDGGETIVGRNLRQTKGLTAKRCRV